jgi:hypothetical protein
MRKTSKKNPYFFKSFSHFPRYFWNIKWLCPNGKYSYPIFSQHVIGNTHIFYFGLIILQDEFVFLSLLLCLYWIKIGNTTIFCFGLKPKYYNKVPLNDMILFKWNIVCFLLITMLLDNQLFSWALILQSNANNFSACNRKHTYILFWPYYFTGRICISVTVIVFILKSECNIQ